jgi:hypothetical protein
MQLIAEALACEGIVVYTKVVLARVSIITPAAYRLIFWEVGE